MEDTEPFELSIDLNVLDHLGINLYSNLPAVLTEVVANAWDADAETVTIDMSTEGVIVITDDGHGMTRSQIQGRYLRVGYRRRLEEGAARSPKFDRPVMGRKGVGKLAVFSIARSVEMHSVSGGVKAGLKMTEEGIRAAMAAKEKYHPESVPPDAIDIEAGTRLILRDLKRERLRRDDLRARLARRFSVIGGRNFSVLVDGRPLGEGDRKELSALQFVWQIGETSLPSSIEPVRSGVLEDRLSGWTDPQWCVKGWIATAYEPKNLKQPPDNLNAIVVLARGRLFQENVLDKINDGRMYTKYLTGYIEADFLDEDELADIATSDRQRVIEDDPRYQALLAYLAYVSRTVVSNWDAWRVEEDHSQAIADNPALAKWLDRLKGAGYKKQAERLISRIHKLSDDQDEKRILYRHAMLGFERLRLTGGANELEQALESGIDVLMKLLADRDVLEACLYRDIVQNRLEVIRSFETHVGEDERERVLQKYLFEHLWLLDPAWDRTPGSEIIEKPVHAEFKNVDAELDPDELRGRVDIKYRNTTGRHVIVELKRANRVLGVEELVKQGRKYQKALQKCLKALQREGEPYEVIFVVGKPLRDADEHEFVKNQLDSIRGRVLTYQQLIERALTAYAGYLDKTKDLDQIQEIIDQL
ncbi:ATP-binding protein [Pseudothauera nasutitermitis]|uniref:ATP-binding protein n=1 Tax=Pseudothauera nasutitermitis TaxID=2565930 RepID=A0A4S4APD6_9RHOO|nr:ATP-binding protein [Pseudothauera nasutitermitis]